jgi:glycosyltransferase involved in cell wall biosynthesis
MLVVLTNYYYPEIGGCSTRITELTRELSDKVKIIVLCPVPSYPFNQELGSFTHRYNSERINDNLEVVRIKVPVPSTGSLRGRVLSEIILVLFALKYFYLYLRKDCKSVLTTSPPFFINCFGLVCKTVFRKEWIQDIRDLWPESIVGTGVAKEDSITVRFLRLLEKMFYHSATKIVTVTEGMAGYIKKILSSSRHDKIFVIPNGYSQEMKGYAEVKKTGDFNTDSEFTVGYVGNLGRAQDLDLLADIIKQASNEWPGTRIRFLIVGEGARKVWLKNELAGYDNVKIQDGTADKEKVAGYYKMIDVFIIPLKNHPVFGTVIPSKVYELILFEKPFLHFTLGELRKIGDASGLGLFQSRENIKDIDNILTGLVDVKARDTSAAKSWKDLSALYLSILVSWGAHCGKQR